MFLVLGFFQAVKFSNVFFIAVTAIKIGVNQKLKEARARANDGLIEEGVERRRRRRTKFLVPVYVYAWGLECHILPAVSTCRIYSFALP